MSHHPKSTPVHVISSNVAIIYICILVFYRISIYLSSFPALSMLTPSCVTWLTRSDILDLTAGSLAFGTPNRTSRQQPSASAGLLTSYSRPPSSPVTRSASLGRAIPTAAPTTCLNDSLSTSTRSDGGRLWPYINNGTRPSPPGRAPTCKSLLSAATSCPHAGPIQAVISDNFTSISARSPICPPLPTAIYQPLPVSRASQVSESYLWPASHDFYKHRNTTSHLLVAAIS